MAGCEELVSNQPPSAKGSMPAPPPLDAGGAAHSVDAAAYFSDPDGDALTYQARSSKVSVATVSTAGSRVTITPVAQGAATIIVTAVDSGGLSAEQRFTVTVRAPPVQTPNRPPAAQGSIPAPPPLDVDASAHEVDVAAYFTDPDGDTLTYQAESSDESVATVSTDASTVSVTARAKGTATITVTATDPDDLTATQEFQVTVKNRAPATQGSIPAPPTLDVGGAAHPVDVAAYFSDPDGDALTYRARSSKVSVATVRTTGSRVTITPVAQGAATITVTATDSGGLSAEQRFTVTVRAPPVQTPNRPPAPQGSIPAPPPLDVGASAHPVDVAAYFSDPDGDPLTYQARSSKESVATVSAAGSTVSVTPRAKGTATITVIATDPGGLSAELSFDVNVRQGAQPPGDTTPAAPVSQGTIPNVQLSVGDPPHAILVAAYFSDPNGDALTYRARSSKVSVATVSAAGSTVSVTPRAKGTATITVTAADPGNLTATQEFQVTVKNRPPAAQGFIPATPPLDPGGAAHEVDVAAYFTDPDGDALTYEAESSDELVATVRTTGNTVSVTPVAKGTATITVTATDPGSLTAAQQFQVTVRNRPPVVQAIIPQTPPLDAGGAAHPVDVAAYFSDPDDDPLTYRARSSKESVATVRTDGSTVSVTPVAKGTATITVIATDPGGLSAELSFDVNVRQGAQPQGDTTPAAPVSQGTIPNVQLSIGDRPHAILVAAYFSDPNGDALTYRARSSKESVATVSAAGSTVSVTPRAKGTATITVTAADPGNLTATQEFQVTVKNRPPAAQGFIPATPPLDPGGAAHEVDVAAYFNDPDGDALTYQARSSKESVATVSAAGSTVSVTPRAKGTATIAVTATDPGNLTATQEFQVTVKNRPPAAQGSIPAPPPLDPGGAAHAVDMAAYFSDPDGDALTYQARSSKESVATVSTDGSTVSVTPRAKGTATITVTATDTGNLTATQQFRATVSNRPPATQGSIPATPELEVGASAHEVDVAAYFSDPDGDALTYQARSSEESVATVRTNGSTVSVTPVAKGAATISVTATDPGNLTATQEFQVTVREASSQPQVLGPLELESLKITGGSGSMYPAFAADVRHYAVRCGSSTTLRVRAQASRAAARLTLLRADTSANKVATGALDASVAVRGNHDVAIDLSDGTDTTRYVVHCIPADFPNVRILKKTASVTDGLLFVTANNSYWVILDNNGVPRFQHREGGRDFRRHVDGTYSVNQWGVKLFDRLDANFGAIPLTKAVGPTRSTDVHDFLITPDGNHLFISYDSAVTRKVCPSGAPCTEDEKVSRGFRDGVIQKVTPQGNELFLWSSWGHLKLADCLVNPDGHTPGDYAHLNSLQVVDGGDIIASFRHCNQVLRIDGTTGAVEWQLGGSRPPPDSNTVFLEITGDSAGKNEFCGQHHATLTASGTVVLFDNGVLCHGPRKADAPFSRAVEYRISTSAGQASHVREVRLPADQGYGYSEGGVTVLDNGHWLISWGALRSSVAVRADRMIAVSEVDPDTNESVFKVNISRPGYTYRAYRYPESDVQIPLNLP